MDPEPRALARAEARLIGISQLVPEVRVPARRESLRLRMVDATVVRVRKIWLRQMNHLPCVAV